MENKKQKELSSQLLTQSAAWQIMNARGLRFSICLMSLRIIGIFLYQEIMFFIELRKDAFVLLTYIVKKKTSCGNYSGLIQHRRKQLIIWERNSINLTSSNLYNTEETHKQKVEIVLFISVKKGMANMNIIVYQPFVNEISLIALLLCEDANRFFLQFLQELGIMIKS